MIWSNKAIDYSKGVDIIDWKTKKIYTEEKAQHPRKIGTWVLTIEECSKILKERRKNERYD